ncbi:MAG: hypothetical protein RI967_1458 [Planctomycetota bacterium]
MRRHPDPDASKVRRSSGFGSRFARASRLAIGALLAAPRLSATPAAALAAALVAALATGSGAFAQYGPVDPYDASLRAIREGIASRNGGTQHAAMVALRGLASPSLRPLFERLVTSDEWSLRVDAVLGLAELGPADAVAPGAGGSRRLDLALLDALPGETDRETTIGAALGLGLLDAAQVESILGWEDLRAPQRALLALELRRLGGRPDDGVIRRIVESRTPEVALVGAALALDCGLADAQELSDAAFALVEAISAERSRSGIVSQVVDSCSSNGLRGAAPYAARLASLAGIAPEVRLKALGSLLVLDASVARPLLESIATADRSQLGLMRLASVLVASGVPLPEADWNRIRNGDRLLETIADAGIAIGAGDLEGGYAKLAQLRHRVTLRAAVDGARRAGPSAERAIGRAALALLSDGDRRELGPLAESVLLALARLAREEPEALRAALAGAESDRDLQEALLLALSSAGTKAAADVALAARGHTSRLGEALVAVLEARHAEKVEPATLEILAIAAGGGVAVDPTIRTQAAWLWLEHADRAADALRDLAPAAADPISPNPTARPSGAPTPERER